MGAVDQYTEALKRLPPQANHEMFQIFSRRAECYTKLGEYKLALQDAHACIELQPSYAEVYAWKGQSHFCLRDYGNALHAFNEGLKLVSSSEWLKEELEDGVDKTLRIMNTISMPAGVKADLQEKLLADPDHGKILSSPSLMKELLDPRAVIQHMQNPAMMTNLSKLLGPNFPFRSGKKAPLLLAAPSDTTVHSYGRLVFARELTSKYVKVTSDGLSAKHRSENNQFGVVFLNSPIPKVGNGMWYFAVRIDEMCEPRDLPDKKGQKISAAVKRLKPKIKTMAKRSRHGLTIGVTTNDPFLIPDLKIPEAASDVEHAWSFGYDGAALLYQVSEPQDIDFKPQFLKQGDVVGLMVLRNPALKANIVDMIVFVNSNMTHVQEFVQVNQSRFYGFIDLLESARAVTLLPAEPPPDLDVKDKPASSECDIPKFDDLLLELRKSAKEEVKQGRIKAAVRNQRGGTFLE